MPPERVFAAFAEPSLRQRWFGPPGKKETAYYELDFRVGGSEVARNVFAPMGVEEALEYRSKFVDLVPDERLVYGYEVYLDGQRRWVSLVTVELTAQDSGTRLDWTEQYAYLILTGDGSQDTAHLRGSMRLLFNRLARLLEPERFEGLVVNRLGIS